MKCGGVWYLVMCKLFVHMMAQQQAAGEIVKQGIELGSTAVDKAKDAYDVVR